MLNFEILHIKICECQSEEGAPLVGFGSGERI